MLKRAARSPPPSPVKPSERCPHCESPNITTKGRRFKKLETIRLYHCRTCDRGFTPGPRALRNKTYPVGEILVDEIVRRDMLDLHGMAHNLINQDYASGTRRNESIGELAGRLAGDILECIAHLQQAYQAVKPLESLLADPDEEWEEEQGSQPD